MDPSDHASLYHCDQVWQLMEEWGACLVALSGRLVVNYKLGEIWKEVVVGYFKKENCRKT